MIDILIAIIVGIVILTFVLFAIALIGSFLGSIWEPILGAIAFFGLVLAFMAGGWFILAALVAGGYLWWAGRDRKPSKV